MNHESLDLSVGENEAYATKEQPKSPSESWHHQSGKRQINRKSKQCASCPDDESTKKAGSGSTSSKRGDFGDELLPSSDDVIGKPEKRRAIRGGGGKPAGIRARIRNRTRSARLAEDSIQETAEIDAFNDVVSDVALDDRPQFADEGAYEEMERESVGSNDFCTSWGRWELAAMSQIMDNLFLCGYYDFDADKLKKHGITLVINMTKDLANRPVPGVRFRRFAADDDPRQELSQYFHPASDAIHGEIQRGGKVLVHCLAGISRSCSIVLAYLIKYHNMSLSEACKVVRARRHFVCPNEGFFKQLIEFEKEMRPGEHSTARTPDDYVREHSAFYF